MTTASVVIPVYNRSGVLARTLAALEAQDFDPEDLEILVADDGSEEDIESVVNSRKSAFRTIYLRQKHDGFGAGRARNLGADRASGEVLILLDSDGIVRPDFISRHVTWHEANENAVVIGGRAHLHGAVFDEEALRRGEVDFQAASTEPVDDFRSVLARRTAGYRTTDEGYRAFVSSNVSLKLDLFRRTGGFDPRFRWWGSEDTELGWRLWQEGTTFIDDPSNNIFHQLDADTAGGAEGRQRARELNRGLLVSLIPHRFYRKGMPDPVPQVPKISVVVHDVPAGAPEEIWQALSTQTLPDFEVIFVADPMDHDPWAGSTAGERRCSFATDAETAVRASRGEYLVFIDGHSAPAPSFLQNISKRLDQRPAARSLTFAIEASGVGVVSRQNELGALSGDWGASLPMSQAVRRRELIRRLGTQVSLSDALADLSDEQTLHTSQPLLALPGLERTSRPQGFVYKKGPAKQLWEEAQIGPTQALRAGLRITKERIRPSRPAIEKRPSDKRDRPGVRYVGWVGKENLGDEVMIEAARALMPWADIEPRGEANNLLLLGGGTLINRNQYLRWLVEHDSPRLERAVLGTGVASPDFWGLTEDTDQWLTWLSTCAYVGVRGPNSLRHLERWGFKGDAEVCGDLALALEVPSVSAVEGRILVAPAWTGGELWGGEDGLVYEALIDAARGWLNDGHEVMFMSCHPSDDRPILQMRDELGAPSGYVPGYVDTEKAQAEIASAEVIVGERLHACVLAAAAHRPFVAVEYRPKVLDFALSVGMDDFVIRSDEVSGDRLAELVDLSASGIAALRESVERYRVKLRQAAAMLHQSLS